ncbi:hypothetical protein DXV76_02880 [Rhodobacteraceae bacterium CCMM004]|nr:hypothetical protein DXV76_02880 [Rhodobacteraceae bacterium CCMM004]
MTATWTCRCGATALEVSGVPQGGAHLQCYCRDCRAWARLHGAEETLDASGGIGLYQTVPDRLRLLRGTEHLRAERLTSKGPFRWYAACCGAPVAITMPTRAVPFATLPVAGFQPPGVAGPVVATVNRGGATGPVETVGSLPRVIAAFAGRTVGTLLRGGRRRTPFFDAEGRPVAPVTRPEAAAREAAYNDS